MEKPLSEPASLRYPALTVIILSVMMVWAFNVSAKTKDLGKRLTVESISAARRTADMPLTPMMIMAKVDEACRLIQEKGEAVFPYLEGDKSPFIFAGTYIWVHTLHDSQMRFHPVNPSLEGKKWLYVRDVKGKLYFAEINEAAKNENGGWVEYYWPKPGETEPELKITYVKKCVYQGVDYVVSCGLYGLSKQALLKQLNQVNTGDQP